jgi:hypothetical protein
MASISDDVRWYRLFLRKTEIGIKTIFEDFRKIGVEPILLKGWAAARNYPQNVPRFFSDIDLATPAADFERCSQRKRTEQLATLNVDLHRELRHLDTTPWYELFERSQLIRLDETYVRILAPEDHLRVLSTHWLTDGGGYQERLWDIYYAIENRPADFDWSLCLDSVSATRRKWVIITIAIARKHLGLDVRELPFAGETEHIPEWVERCLAKEWASNVRLRPLHACLNDPKLLFQQIRKRIPPNPIQATVETEGEFDERPRWRYQGKNLIARVAPSLFRVRRSIAERLWKTGRG